LSAESGENGWRWRIDNENIARRSNVKVIGASGNIGEDKWHQP
jgi:hypothetical protein